MRRNNLLHVAATLVCLNMFVLQTSLAVESPSTVVGLSSVDLSDPLDALAGELIRDRNLPAEESAQFRQKMIQRAKRLFAERQLPVLLEQNGAKTVKDLDANLRKMDSSVSQLEEQFVWRVFINELKRN